MYRWEPYSRAGPKGCTSGSSVIPTPLGPEPRPETAVTGRGLTAWRIADHALFSSSDERSRCRTGTDHAVASAGSSSRCHSAEAGETVAPAGVAEARARRNRDDQAAGDAAAEAELGRAGQRRSGYHTVSASCCRDSGCRAAPNPAHISVGRSGVASGHWTSKSRSSPTSRPTLPFSLRTDTMDPRLFRRVEPEVSASSSAASWRSRSASRPRKDRNRTSA